MKHSLSNSELDNWANKAQEIAEKGHYTDSTSTAKNHATLQSLIVLSNAELIKTIRHLDEKNGKLQKLLFWLSVIATIATVTALLK
jgi:hypothetical protein